MAPRAIRTDGAPEAVGPYSQAIVAHGMVYVSGQLPLDPVSGTLIENDIQAATDLVMSNLEAILKAAGSELAWAVKITVYLQSLGNFAAFNQAYSVYFKDNPPARACVEVAALPKGAPLEIDVVAMVKSA